MTNKTWHLTINNRPLNLTLAPPNQRGFCQKCQLEKEISVISEKPFGLVWEEKEFCWSCSLDNLRKLEQNNYKIENKKAVIKEIRTVLNSQPVADTENDDNQQLEYYG